MTENKELPVYGYIRSHAARPLWFIRVGYGRSAAGMTEELLAAFGMNVKNEQGLINQLSERVAVKYLNGIPSFVYVHKGILKPLMKPAGSMDGRAYRPSIFIHTEGKVHELFIRKSRLIDWIIDASQSIHDRRKKPQDRDDVLFHLFESGQLVARHKGLIDW